MIMTMFLKSSYPVWVVFQREVKDQFRDWRVIFPILGLTMFFPFLMNFTAQQVLDFVRRYGASIIGERMVPFLLMIVGFFPISVSLVIALETFVGEKERGSIEPLLNTPLHDWQLYLGKLFSATVPPIFGSFLGMAVYLASLSYASIPLPPLDLLVLIITLTTVQAFMMTAGAVAVSSQATSVRAANLLASFIVIPSALLIQGEAILMFWYSYLSLWWVVAGMLILTILLVRVGLVHFRREELIGREIDVLNLKWIWSVFSRRFLQNARTGLDWYMGVFRDTLSRLRWALFIIAVLSVASVFYGASLADEYFFPLNPLEPALMEVHLRQILGLDTLFNFQPVIFLFWQNLRVLLLAMLLGQLSLGVLSVLPLMTSLAAVGYLVNLLLLNGYSSLVVFGLLAPHSLFEISAAFLSTAAALQVGAILATPTPGRTVGESWLDALADYTRVALGLVLPLLILGSMVEAWVTPHVAIWLLTR